MVGRCQIQQLYSLTAAIHDDVITNNNVTIAKSLENIKTLILKFADNKNRYKQHCILSMWDTIDKTNKKL